jgi:Ca2+-binding RTX toxin-like protein
MIAGHDTIIGGGNNDKLYGDFGTVGALGKVTAGNDTIRGGAGNDRIYGEGLVSGDGQTIGGNDTLCGDAGDDDIIGGTGNDLIYGGRENDRLRGDSGNDLLDGDPGIDFMFGGAGNDTFVVDSVNDVVHEYDTQGIDTVKTTLQSYTLETHVEHLTFIGSGDFEAIGNTLNNAVTGGAGADFIFGLAGNDRLFGGRGADTLYGDADNDVLNGGAGGDTIDGGDGFDTASYADSERGVKIALNGSITATGDAIGDQLARIEALEGTSFGDLLIGSDGANRLTGGAGNDTLGGEAGSDVLIGGLGVDTLFGGVDADSFVFNVAPTYANRDTIADFQSGIDKIQLDNAVFKGIGTGGKLPAAIFKLSTQAKDANDRIIYDETSGKLFYDVDGSGKAAAVHFATLANKPVISFADFEVI